MCLPPLFSSYKLLVILFLLPLAAAPKAAADSERLLPLAIKSAFHLFAALVLVALERMRHSERLLRKVPLLAVSL